MTSVVDPPPLTANQTYYIQLFDRGIVVLVVAAVLFLVWRTMRSSSQDSRRGSRDKRLRILTMTAVLALVLLALAEIQLVDKQAITALFGALIGGAFGVLGRAKDAPVTSTALAAPDSTVS
jgi:hypothetical protein